MNDENVYRHIKLSNGEEIVCEIVNYDKHTITIIKAMKLLLVVDDYGTTTNLAPFMLSQTLLSTPVTLNSAAIVASSTIPLSLINGYLDAVEEYERENMLDIEVDLEMDLDFDLGDNVVSFNKDKNKDPIH